MFRTANSSVAAGDALLFALALPTLVPPVGGIVPVEFTALSPIVHIVFI